jgi:hypothetical protein
MMDAQRNAITEVSSTVASTIWRLAAEVSQNQIYLRATRCEEKVVFFCLVPAAALLDLISLLSGSSVSLYRSAAKVAKPKKKAKLSNKTGV